jgi:prephenate dehydrogenase
MGGSLGKALNRYKVADKIYGYDHNLSHQTQAIELGLIDEICDIDKLKTLDMIVLCIPVGAIINFSKRLVDITSATTVVDFGSTKEQIANNIPQNIRKNFVLAHPMVGTEKFGPYAAVDDFYEDGIVVLCDTDKNREKDLSKVLYMLNKIKTNIVYMSAKEHDKHVCYMSHLPHAISFGLANTVMDHENPQNIVTLAGGGVESMSRIAKSSPNMWADIFQQNKTNLLKSLDIFDKNMQKLKNMLEKENFEEINQWMTKANELDKIVKD